MSLPPEDRWHRRYWGYYNRPYSGCGCLWTILVIIILWWLLSLLFPPLIVWRQAPPPTASPRYNAPPGP